MSTPAVDDELDAWLRLVHRPGLGRAAVRRLLAALGSPQAVAEASIARLREIVGARQADDCIALPEGHARRLAATRAWLAAAPGRSLVTLGDPDYPALLLQTADPPLLLYLEGRPALLNAPSVAIVGSRHPTPQGEDNARRLARELGEAGWTVVSGLAAGIDGAAHAGALDHGGDTIAVVGTGLDQVYPSSHRGLAMRIAAAGLMLSEFALGSPPLASNFPQRNRIIAGLSRGTLVVEAALRSGSLITARQAAEAGRDVFAVPGSIQSTQTRGCHALLRDGARLVESVDDILEELAPASSGRPPGDAAAGLGAARRRAMSTPRSGRRAVAQERGAAEDHDKGHDDGQNDDPKDEVLRVLGHDPVSLDALIARCGWPAPALNARLMTLELQGQVARLPGGLFQRRRAT